MILSRSIIVAGITALCLSCGSGSSGGGSAGGNNSKDPLDPNEQKDPRDEEWNYAWMTIKIPLGNFPSLINKGEYVKACQTGQSYFLDRCFDEIVVNLDTFTIAYQDSDEEIKALSPDMINQDWFSTLIFSWGSYFKYYETLLKDILHTSTIEEGGILSPTNEVKIHPETRRLSSTEVYLHTSWGWKTTTAIAHEWDLKGKVILAGKEFNLPIYEEDLEKAFPDYHGGLYDIPGVGNFEAFHGQDKKIKSITLFYR